MPTPKEERDLAALADGSLPERRRPAVEQLAARSSEAQALLAEQRRALAAIAGLTEPAPAALRGRIEAVRQRSLGTRRERVHRWSPPAGTRSITGWGLAATATAAIVILLFALPSGGPGAPSVASAAAVALRAITAAAPATIPPSSLLRVRAAAGVPYPDWSGKYGWRAIGMRSDGLGDRTATTVFYRQRSETIAYTIVSGASLALPAQAAPQRREGTTLHLFPASGRTVVEWTRLGHTCLLSGVSTPASTLVDLAAYRGGGHIPF